MRRTILFALLMSGVAFPVLADKRVALVFGQDKYELIRPLNNATNDAAAIEEKLEELGFDVTLETNRDLRRMRRALEDFTEDAAGADVALVFFAGHGVELAGENRLLPTDADATTLETLKETSLPLEEVRETVARVSKIGLVMLDACRNDPFGALAGSEGRGAVALSPTVRQDVKPGLGRLGGAENLLYTFSAAPGATAADGAGDNSPFTEALVRYLDTDGLEIRSVMTLVQQEVYDLSRGSQLPYVENGLPDVFFASTAEADLPERERLLLAMADVTADLRNEVERLAAEKDMPLAPLYGALISSDARALSQEQRLAKLTEAADAFVATREQIKTMASSDPQVSRLRDEAERQLVLGAFDTARGKLSEAAGIDSKSRDALKANFVERTASEASTHIIAGGASRTNLKYDLAIESFEKAAALFGDVDREPLQQAQRQQQLTTLDTLGELYVTVGSLDKARKVFEQVQATAERLQIDAPQNALWSAALAKNHSALANVINDQGDSQGALDHYARSLELRQARMTAAPDDLEAQAGAADTLMRMGQIRSSQGDLAKAIEAAEAGRDIMLRLTDADSRDEWLITLSTGHSRLGALYLWDRKTLDKALESFRASLEIDRQLVERSPDDARIRNGLATSLVGLGDVRMQNKDYRGALEAFEEARGNSQKLATDDPSNAKWERNLSVTTERLADAVFQADYNDRDKAVQLYRSALDARRKLADRDPTNAVWQADLAFAYEKLGSMMTAIFDDMGAIDYYKLGLAANERLAALDRNNIEWQRAVMYSLRKVGWSLWQAKKWPEAHDYLDRRLDFISAVQASKADSVELRGDVIAALGEMGDMRDREKDFEASADAYRRGLETARRFADDNPESPGDVYQVAAAAVSLGDALVKAGAPERAFAAYLDAAQWVVRAISLSGKEASWWRQKSLIANRIGNHLEIEGDLKGAVASFRTGMAAIETALELRPTDAGYADDRTYSLGRIKAVEEKLAQAGSP